MPWRSAELCLSECADVYWLGSPRLLFNIALSPCPDIHVYILTPPTLLSSPPYTPYGSMDLCSIVRSNIRYGDAVFADANSDFEVSEEEVRDTRVASTTF